MFFGNLITATCGLVVLLPAVCGDTMSSALQSPSHQNSKRRMTPHFGSFTAGEGEQRRNRIEQALQDMAEVVNGNDFGVLTSNDQTFTSIYNKYFPPQYKNAIKQIFKNIAGTGIQDRSTGDSLQQINFNDIDSQSLCTDVSAYVLADRDNPPTIDQLVIHFCSSNGKDMYQYPDLSQITCDKLDDFVSWKMLSLGGYALLHEVSHAFTSPGPGNRGLSIWS
ncbi:hypothetical protein EV356DRAFT_382505 [Viridothelium virens]|uniref:Lysine-specific metallo-endopeptidase domain-containing protein n=1 Tax=Viridothelium virens TaxID=1048519 RepID=A0A6A6HIL2_VIRVR|nr:hypothetical protein EV356DRAFT_382505 [Viridothelium virens]